MSTSKVHLAAPSPSATVNAIHAVGGQMNRHGRRSTVSVTENPAEVTCGVCLSAISRQERLTSERQARA